MPFRIAVAGDYEFAVFRRADCGFWQGLAGGGEGTENPRAAAVREAGEEAGLAPDLPYFRLDACSSVPVEYFAARVHWPRELLVIPEFSFAVDCTGVELRISSEHTEYLWGSYEEANRRLKWDSNRTALWELRERLRLNLLRQ